MYVFNIDNQLSHTLHFCFILFLEILISEIKVFKVKQKKLKQRLFFHLRFSFSCYPEKL